MQWLFLLPAIFLGWNLGANDAANIFGTSVASGLVKYRTAIIVSAIFVVLGAITEGTAGLHTISSVSAQNIVTAAVNTFSAGLTVFIMTLLRLPVSTSQAIVGAIVGVGLLKSDVNWWVLLKVVICWVTTPLGAAFFGFILYKLLAIPYNKIKSIQTQEFILKISALIFGAYGAYSLGANNVANVTGTFTEIIGPFNAAWIGGVSIALGILTFSYGVMMTVGKKIVYLDHFSALIAVLSQAITVWIYAIIGVPVSTSQAIVGAVIGSGLAAGMGEINMKMIFKIIKGWLGTPTIAGIISVALYSLLRLFGYS